MLSSRIAACAVLVAMTAFGRPAAAFSVYVSNEKDNTVSIIDSESLEVVDTLKVGQRPRGIILTKDGKHLLVCASDDDTIQVIDVASKQIVKTLPSGPDPALRRQRGRQPGHRDRRRAEVGDRRGAGRRRAGGHGH